MRNGTFQVEEAIKPFGRLRILLDALIYHLRMQEDKYIEEVDRLGRSEEEQVGADEDLDADGGPSTAQKQEALLDISSMTVTIVINRMVGQLNAYATGKQTLENVLIRLLAYWPFSESFAVATAASLGSIRARRRCRQSSDCAYWRRSCSPSLKANRHFSTSTLWVTSFGTVTMWRASRG